MQLEIAQYNIRGIYGPLIELFTVEEKFCTTVEVAAVIVDTDETAAKILEILNQLRARVNVSLFIGDLQHVNALPPHRDSK